MISPLPLAREYSQDALQGCRVRRIVGERKGLAAGSLEELAVAQRIGDVKAKGAGLAGVPKKTAGGAPPHKFWGFLSRWGGAPRLLGGAPALVAPPRRAGASEAGLFVAPR